MASSFPIIDSHVHLWPGDESASLAWLDESSPLAGQFSIDQYRVATGDPANLRGLVVVEADRANAAGADFTHPLAELSFAARVAAGLPKPGQGHAPADARLCLGIVPWAPVHAGREVLGRYMEAARRAAGPSWRRVRGVRYLLQDKEAGTMLTPEFIESLKLLGKAGLVFDLGVDQHRRGRGQLEEAVEMIDRVHEGVSEEEKVVFVVDHLCKPDLSIINPNDPSFIAWRTAIFTLSKCSKVYIKLSGLFSEMPESLRGQSALEIFMALHSWLATLLAAFGSSRIMFGSDWPVCTLGMGDQSDVAWLKWRLVVEKMCYMASLSDEDQAMIWGGTAIKAYGLDMDAEDDEDEEDEDEEDEAEEEDAEEDKE